MLLRFLSLTLNIVKDIEILALIIVNTKFQYCNRYVISLLIRQLEGPFIVPLKLFLFINKKILFIVNKKEKLNICANQDKGRHNSKMHPFPLVNQLFQNFSSSSSQIVKRGKPERTDVFVMLVYLTSQFRTISWRAKPRVEPSWLDNFE